MSKAINIRISEKEMKELQTYCTEHDMSYSEYIRKLIVTHLGMAEDFKVISGAKIR